MKPCAGAAIDSALPRAELLPSRAPSISRWWHSLSGRLSLMATLVLLVFLVVLSGVLERAYRTSLDEAKARELQIYIYTLLAVAELDGDSLYLPLNLPEQRFNQPDSGLIGAVMDARGRVIWRSQSALSLPNFSALPLPLPLRQGQKVFAEVQLPDLETPYSSFRQGIAWGLDNELQFTFVILEDAAPLHAQVQQFSGTLWRWLGIGALALIAVQLLVLRWGLAPLRGVTQALKKMQQGGTDTLQGNFPQELVPLTDNLNLLIENERRQREKTRHTLGDLAHSLKTPLAVLKGLDLGKDPQAAQEALAEQVQRMDGIISYQLKRAVASSPKSILRGVKVQPIAEKILTALDKVYRGKPMDAELLCDDEVLFYGDEGDLLEMLGNLLDNGYKYGGGKLLVKIDNIEDQRGLEVLVSDNGPGLSEDQWQQVVQRGVRADQQQQGQGIGLAVVVDIVESYHGEIGIVPAGQRGEEDLGGLTLRVRL
ncbi:ATP-binding protein [Microbulbifer hydrolyticus]|uniref:histidine kinase n=1 Tax=Microbulbifer hydrolyticus TaxID=48074 RepID=A0AA89P8V5_9GAMM|nr:ATP-binding protein [Microbulbifer hydrolyticus]MBB5209870.1 two-component system sensor histidine kinase PhoQ [Microbulbifer hydrolyticus]